MVKRHRHGWHRARTGKTLLFDGTFALLTGSHFSFFYQTPLTRVRTQQSAAWEDPCHTETTLCQSMNVYIICESASLYSDI